MAEEGSGTYPCRGCPWQEREPLLPENHEAMRTYGRLATQLNHDLHLAPILFERMTREWSDDDVGELMDRVSLIHATMSRIADARAKAEKG